MFPFRNVPIQTRTPKNYIIIKDDGLNFRCSCERLLRKALAWTNIMKVAIYLLRDLFTVVYDNTDFRFKVREHN